MAFCDVCGAELEKGVSFCTHCGSRVLDPLNVEIETAVFTADVEDPFEEHSTSIQPLVAAAPTPPRQGLGKGALVGIGVGVCAAVAVVGFAIFYLTNPLGLTTGIFSTSAAAIQAQADADAAAAQAELDEAQEKTDALQAELDQAQRDIERAKSERGDVVLVLPDGSTVESAESDGNHYLLPDSGTTVIDQATLDGLSDYQLYLARNEIYARHGYAFVNDDLKEYFEGQPWYSALYPEGEFDDRLLSRVEVQNINNIAALERSRGSAYSPS